MVRHEEGVLALHDQPRDVTGRGGGADVVRIARAVLVVRFEHHGSGEVRAGPERPLRIIATERNYASLSQAQIILWTLVVARDGRPARPVPGQAADLPGAVRGRDALRSGAR